MLTLRPTDQGEENDIVILSLVRSRPDGKIGFLSNTNRVCVALSRAKHGFYLFGNAHALTKGSPLWTNVVTMSKLRELLLKPLRPTSVYPHHKS